MTGGEVFTVTVYKLPFRYDARWYLFPTKDTVSGWYNKFHYSCGKGQKEGKAAVCRYCQQISIKTMPSTTLFFS
jgi:hypothetical protein